MCVGGLAAFAVTFTVSAARYRESVDSATTLRVNPAIAVLYGIALVGAVLGSSLYVMFSARESVRVLFSGGVVFRSLMAALLGLSLLGLIGLVRSREPGRLRLTPTGHTTRSSCRTPTATVTRVRRCTGWCATTGSTPRTGASSPTVARWHDWSPRSSRPTDHSESWNSTIAMTVSTASDSAATRSATDGAARIAYRSA